MEDIDSRGGLVSTVDSQVGEGCSGNILGKVEPATIAIAMIE
jgi:hypothetical protein